jgi:hypothetical protein
MTFENDKYIIRKTLQIITKAWLNNQLEILNDYFDDRMIIISKKLNDKTTGRDACILDYKHFVESADIQNYNQSDPLIEFWGNTAVAFYSFDINYKVNSNKFCVKGEDTYVFNREDENANTWKAVCRTLTILEKNKIN